MYLDADLYLIPRMDGFITADGIVPGAHADVAYDKRMLNEAYRKTEMQRQEEFSVAIRQVLDASVAESIAAFGNQRWFNPMLVFPAFREFAHKSLQPEIENPRTIEMEPWVDELRDAEVERFGFVAYRLAYGENEQEWKEYLKKVNDGLSSVWEGVVGADEIRGKATLHWVYGSNEGITEGDMDGARQ